MKILRFPICLLCVLWVSAVSSGPAEMVEVRKIWDRAPHNAFTDLVRFRGRWLCVFREGTAHVSPDGALRVITSPDGREWSSAALIRYPGADLRDAKITVTPRGRLLLSGAAALHQPAEHRHRSLAWFSRDGATWSDPVTIGDPDLWLWRITWHDGSAYSIGYGTAERRFIRLYSGSTVRALQSRVDTLLEEGYPNEHSLLFDRDGACLCLLRRDGTPGSALLGFSRPPYREWGWKDLGVGIGGPQMVRLPDGRIVAGARLYDGRTRTGLCWVEPEAGRLTEFLALPSGGDTSYPGLVWHDGLLWVSYYSSHEGKTSVYLAKVRIPAG